MSITYLGIDIAKDKFDAALLMDNGKFKTKKFSNTTKGCASLVDWFKKYWQQDIHVCMEATGIYGKKLATYLSKKVYKTSVVNPARIKGFGQSELTRNKTDKADAKLIARFCKSANPDLWQPEEPHVEQLRDWVKQLERLKQDKIREGNRLESLGLDVAKEVKKHMKFLDKQLGITEDKIKTLIKNNDDFNNKNKLLLSIPGIGDVTVAMILAYMGQPDKFNNAKQVAAFFGLNPRQFQSGSSIRGKTRLSKVGNSTFRKALFLPAIVARRHNSIIKKFCDNLERAGKSKMLIIGAAMRKLVHMIYGVLKSNKPFDATLVTY